MSKDIIEKRGPFDVYSREVVLENHWYKVEKDTVFNRENGKNAVFNVIRYHGGAVDVLPIDSEGNVYLVKEFKYAINKVIVGDPGGFIDAGEKPLTAAKRELREELGIVANKWTDMGEMFSYGSVNEASHHLFIAEGLVFGDTSWDENESIELVKVPLSKAVEMVMKNEIDLASSMVLILKASQKGSLT